MQLPGEAQALEREQEICSFTEDILGVARRERLRYLRKANEK